MSGGGDISYDAIVMLALFLIAQWYAARICISLKLPTIPVEIGVGLVQMVWILFQILVMIICR